VAACILAVGISFALLVPRSAPRAVSNTQASPKQSGSRAVQPLKSVSTSETQRAANLDRGQATGTTPIRMVPKGGMCPEDACNADVEEEKARKAAASVAASQPASSEATKDQPATQTSIRVQPAQTITQPPVVPTSQQPQPSQSQTSGIDRAQPAPTSQQS